MGQYLITDLSDFIGYALQQFILFFLNILGGWILYLAVITIGFIIIIYFRFIRRRILSNEMYEQSGVDDKYRPGQ